MEQQQQQPSEPPIIPSTQPEMPETKKRNWLIITLVIAVVLIVGGGVSYALLKKSSTEQNSGKDTIKLVKVTYTKTDNPNSPGPPRDQPPILANGSYLQLNGNGELNYNGKVVKKNDGIVYAVLSKNGKHYAYQVRLSTEGHSYGDGPDESELYIDNRKVSKLGKSKLLAIADNGKDYLVETYGNVVPSAIYNTYSTNYREEFIKLNNTKIIATAPYGFINAQYSADLQNVLVSRYRDIKDYIGKPKPQSRSLHMDWYYNNQWLSNCSGDNPTDFADVLLSADGSSAMCRMRTYYNTQNDSSRAPDYKIDKVQIFVNNTLIAKTTEPIDAADIRIFGLADKDNWLLFGGNVVITSDGRVKQLSEVLPEAATALGENDCTKKYISDPSFVFVNNDKFAMLVPCSSKKLFTKGFDFSSVPDLSRLEVSGLEYSGTAKVLYIYTK